MMIDANPHLPRITVITVVYNGARHLEETIVSVLSQEYANLSYIIIDGCSTDGTQEIIERYRERLAYSVSEPDRGIYDAMNKGWAAAEPDSFILFLGAGDRIVSLPKDMGVYGVNDVIYGEVGIGERIFPASAGFALRFNNTLHHQALLIHKSFHPLPPFDLRFKVYADFDFNQRLLKMGARFVRSATFQAYALPGGLSSRKPYGETLRIVAKNFGLFWSIVALGYLAPRKFFRVARATLARVVIQR